MLGGLLSREECAECRICCSFTSYDIWETPLITPELAEKILSVKPEQEFISREGCYILKMQKEPDKDLFYCSLLDHRKGCILGTEKPFDCRIWPFRVMSLEGRRVITVSPVCPVVSARPIQQISEKCRELSKYIFSEAERHPEFVKNYIQGYPIIFVEPEP